MMKKGCIAVEIKYLRQKQMSLKVIYDIIGRFKINDSGKSELIKRFENVNESLR